MLTYEEIERLAEFDAQTSEVLSVYLDPDPSAQMRRAYRVGFDDLVKAASADIEGARRVRPT